MIEIDRRASAKTISMNFKVPIEKRNDVLDAMQRLGISYDDDEEYVSVDPVPAGEALKGFRAMHGWTQAQLAEMTGISQRHISQMERGKLPIGKERAKRLAAAFGANYRAFL